jgi:diguanylate cyclase (GGDEF)-like protein/PAS domain S-box-containing protein
MMFPQQKRILLVDDNKSIHDDFCKILGDQSQATQLDADEIVLFGRAPTASNATASLPYLIDSAYQGEEALKLVQKALSEGHPYALAFVDMLMPPGWNGIETIKQLWAIDPALQVVICSAYSDYSWEEITQQLNGSDNLLILKKPFESIEIRQLASALTIKWELKQQVQYQIENLQTLVQERTEDLQKSLSLMNATLESTEEGIIVVSKNKEIIKYNNIFLHMFGISEESIKSEETTAIFHRISQQLEEPVLFLTAMENLEKKLKTKGTKEWKLKTGKVFELYKNSQYLNKKNVGIVCSFRDITERKKLEELLLYQSTHDSLTGLPNRILLVDRTHQAILQAKRYNLLTGFLLLDVDNFKQVNDTFGHKMGDALLKVVAKRLQSSIRESDTVTRLGGDEFVILLNAQSSQDNIEEITEKLIKNFSQPCQIEDQEIITTVSIGISVYPKDGQDYDELMKNADVALYHAKEMGRNTFEFYEPKLNQDSLQKVELETHLRHAVERNELVLHYQPLIDLDSNRIVGVEALVRWQHPTLGTLLPNTFIPLAESTRLIVPIGEWVLRTACQQNKIWQKLGFSGLRVAVNMSKVQFQQNNFVEFVRKILKETKLEPNCLELEITESIITTNFSDFFLKMKELKELGVYLVIDDFGTGYSNLSYLRYFPFDKVKIDKTFIDEIIAENNDRCIVDAIINMSKKMGLEVVAEGVEKIEQIDYLREHHSDQVQGYYFSEPLDAQACTDLLSKGRVEQVVPYQEKRTKSNRMRPNQGF